jgi:hypothetical protein
MTSVEDVATLPPEKLVRATDIQNALDMSPEDILAEALDIMAQTH